MAHADTLEPIHFSELVDIESVYSAPWFLSHRVDLHNELKLLATQDEGPGEPAKIHLRAEVTGIVSITVSAIVSIVSLSDSRPLCRTLG